MKNFTHLRDQADQQEGRRGRTSGRIKAKSFLVEWINQMTFILSYIMNPPEK